MIRSLLRHQLSVPASAFLRLMTSSASSNPLLAPWTGPYGGLPPFSTVKISHFLPAITETIAAFHSDLAAITSCPQPPTFANTMEAYCAAGLALESASNVYNTSPLIVLPLYGLYGALMQVQHLVLRHVKP